MDKRVVNIYLESNPNPSSLKFVADIVLLPEGYYVDFPDIESAEASPLAKKLFQFDYVARVFFMSNFVTITKKGDIDWLEIQNELRQTIKRHLESGQPVIPEDFQPFKEEEKVIPETDMKILTILDEYIRPAVEQDGGAITFDSFQDGIVKVVLQGSCSGCPSSTVTLKAGIENLLKRMVPEVQSVEAVEM